MEEWRTIPEHPGYEVSDLGRVRSIDRWVPYSDGRRAWFKGTVLRPGKVAGGYLQVSLGGETPNKKVHLLVLLAFVGPPPPGQEARHFDDNRQNNKATNLLYGTKSQNQRDRQRNGNGVRGTQNPMAKLTEAAVREIRSRKLRIPELLAKYSISRAHLHDIRNGKRWGWLT